LEVFAAALLLNQIPSIPFLLKSILYGVFALLLAHSIKICAIKVIAFIKTIHFQFIGYKDHTISLSYTNLGQLGGKISSRSESYLNIHNQVFLLLLPVNRSIAYLI